MTHDRCKCGEKLDVVTEYALGIAIDYHVCPAGCDVKTDKNDDSLWNETERSNDDRKKG